MCNKYFYRRKIFSTDFASGNCWDED